MISNIRRTMDDFSVLASENLRSLLEPLPLVRSIANRAPVSTAAAEDAAQSFLNFADFAPEQIFRAFESSSPLALPPVRPPPPPEDLIILDALERCGGQLDSPPPGVAPLVDALTSGHGQLTSLFLALGADPNLSLTNPARGSTLTPLQLAVEALDTTAIDALLRAGADTRVRDVDGHTTLERLVIRPMTVAADVACRATGLLLDAGVECDAARLPLNKTLPAAVFRRLAPPLSRFALAANDEPGALARQLAAGADPNEKTENGMTLLHWACAGDAPGCVEVLLSTLPSPLPPYDVSPLFYCCTGRSPVLPQTLVAAGVDPNGGSGGGLPVHLCLLANDLTTLRNLHTLGAALTTAELQALGREDATPPMRLALSLAGQRALAPSILKFMAECGCADEELQVSGEAPALPLFIAIRELGREHVRALLAGGASADATCGGMKPFEYLLFYAKQGATNMERVRRSERVLEIGAELAGAPRAQGKLIKDN